MICFSQDAYDKYEEAQHAASLKASGGNCGGGSENLVCAGFHPKAAKTASISYVEGKAPACNNGQVLFQKAETQYIVRRLTPLECCRLQGMPDWWLDGVEGSDAARYKMFGNGMALPNALYIMEGISETENGR